MARRRLDFFAGRRVFLTGATSGIGREMALQLRAAGARLFATGRDREALAEFSGQPADLADPDAVETLAVWLEREAGTLDVVILNAGLGHWRTIAAETGPTVDEVLAVNLRAPIQLTRRLWPLLERAEAPRLGFVSSVASVFPGAGYPVYAATKAGLSHFARSVAAEQSRVRVTWIEPGPTTTDFHRRAGIAFSSGQRLVFATARDCAAFGLDAIARGRGRAVHTPLMKAVALLSSVAPALMVSLARRRSRARG